MKKGLFVAVLLAGFLLTGAAQAVTVTFDDIGTGSVLSSYAGITWGTSSIDSYYGYEGYWAVAGMGYAVPHSSPQMVLNTWGPNDLWFSFSAPVTFNGAWFATAGANPENRATEVRMRDNLGNTTGWLALQSQPQYLAADFIGSTTIYIERIGGSNPYNAGWYTMDDVTYNGGAVPIPGAILLFAPALAGLAAVRRRFTK